MKTMDYQLSIRYQVNPFGSNSPRFTRATSTKKSAVKNQYINNTLIVNQEKDKKAEIIRKYLKDKSEGKQSFYFMSKSNRFDPNFEQKVEPQNKVIL
jgi:type III secretory pathway component EscR